MISQTTKRFRETLAGLPKDIQQQAKDCHKLFAQNPKHPSLRFKKVHTTEPVYSARINIDYRALCIVDGKEVIGVGFSKRFSRRT